MPLLAQAVCLEHNDVVKNDRAGGLTPPPQLVLVLAEAEPRRALQMRGMRRSANTNVDQDPVNHKTVKPQILFPVSGVAIAGTFTHLLNNKGRNAMRPRLGWPGTRHNKVDV